jgi:hypothetical protein
MCFVIMNFGFWFEVGLLISFSAEAWPTTALFQSIIDQLQHAWATGLGFDSFFPMPKARLVVIFSYSSHSPHSPEHLEKREVSKKLMFSACIDHNFSAFQPVRSRLAAAGRADSLQRAIFCALAMFAFPKKHTSLFATEFTY